MNLLTFLAVLGSAYCDHHGRTNMPPDRTTIVHLFEWKWTDIADECERFLAPKGYGAVQISPPSENGIIHLSDGSRPWFERYQPISYILTTRSGTEEELLNMTTRCNRVGVRIYADVVVNHMTGNLPTKVGTAGSTAHFEQYSYPAVPYNASHFHEPHCGINNYNNADEVRKCELLGLKDLDHKQPYVRNKIAGFLNHLIQIGVAGFRVDAAKHMWPADLGAIYSQLNDLNTDFGFPPNTRPYIYQEVIYHGDGEIKPDEYLALGDVTEFRVGNELKNVFRGKNAMKWLISWGEQWALSPRDTALVFIDNHDTQRQSDVLTYKESRAYKGAVAFMLAHPYGVPRVMSSYFFRNGDQGPPMNAAASLLSPSINSDDTCGNGYVCEHRWRQIYQMAAFRNAVKDTNITNWWDNGNNQIAFSRGNRGFIAFNIENSDLNQNLQTGLPAGKYCDVITGKRQGDSCSGKTVTVGDDGRADISVPGNGEDTHLAIHVGPESSLQNQEPLDFVPLNGNQPSRPLEHEGPLNDQAGTPTNEGPGQGPDGPQGDGPDGPQGARPPRSSDKQQSGPQENKPDDGKRPDGSSIQPNAPNELPNASKNNQYEETESSANEHGSSGSGSSEDGSPERHGFFYHVKKFVKNIF